MLTLYAHDGHLALMAVTAAPARQGLREKPTDRVRTARLGPRDTVTSAATLRGRDLRLMTA
jgi:hypothetical protein